MYIEVKRIRKSEIENRRDEFLQSFTSMLREIRQNYGILTDCNELKIDELNENQIYLRLLNELNNIKEDIEEQLDKITRMNSEWSSIDISLERFAENFSISVVKIPPEKQDGKVHYYGGLYNIPYTGMEYRKFGDIVFDKIHQLIPGSMNVLFVLADNECHEFDDLLDSIQSIKELIIEENEEFFCKRALMGKKNS